MRLTLAALSRPITIIVAVLGLAVAAGLAVRRMPVDIFPTVGDPAVYVAQPYGGMDPAQMDGFLTYYYEYHFLYISGIEHIESKSIQGVALLKLVFHPGTDMNQAMAQVVGYVNRARAFMPPGAVPPFITRFDAGSVPIGQLVFSSPTRLPAEMQDIALNRVRPLFATLPGVSAPPPFGGNQRTIVVRLDPERLQSYRVSPEEAIAAVNRATVVTPSGNVRTGDLNRIASTNATLGGNLSELLEAPVRVGSGTTVYLRDLGVVENGTDIVSSYAHVNGKRTVYIPVTKRSDASTLSVIAAVRQNLAAMQALVPEDVEIRLEFDQSRYVTSAIRNLVTEGLLGALLTGLMVLLFLRDWKSALIVVATIPGALMAAVVGLWLGGQTMNLMTLGGLALAVGVLVDEATVAIESIHSQLGRGAAKVDAVIEASRVTSVPRLLAMLVVVAVFLPAFSLVGVPRQLFVPLALAVTLAMAASYVLSSTLVPVLSAWWLRTHADDSRSFAKAQARYAAVLHRVLAARGVTVIGYLVACAAVLAVLLPRLGVELFPVTGSDQLQMRLRAPTGTRIERTEPLTLRVLEAVKNEVGADNVSISTAFIGVQPASYPINTIYLWTSGPHEAVLLVSLTAEASRDAAGLRERLRARLKKAVPEMTVSFEAGDIVSQVMSFGSPTPVEVAVQGLNLQQNREHAAKIQAALAPLPFLRDLQIAQPLDYPTLNVNIDRERAGQYGLTMSNVARSLLTATASSRFVEPNYWRDPVGGNAFQIQVEIPQSRIASAQDLEALPVMAGGTQATTLGDVASVATGVMPGMIERYNGQRVVSMTANLHGMTLGQALPAIRDAIATVGEVPRGVTVALRGQVPALEQTVSALQSGLGLSVLAIALLLTAYFQSWRLALAVLAAVPAALSGVVLMLWATGTSMNVQSFVGATMATGIGVANAILLVSFAEAARRQGESSLSAAATGSVGRLRAVLMTAAAMMIGMVPMALGLGDGGDQAAPLGRAVIGGLMAATAATLLVVPACYALLQASASTRTASLNPSDLASDGHAPS
ncbi:MAG: efflux RND transporter permease subunit [Vicinamibacterales bacterium]|jgi:multidrug efflux pump subunit AcrB